jgi:hypothetical protein
MHTDKYILPLFKKYKVCGSIVEKHIPSIDTINNVVARIKHILVTYDICIDAIHYKCNNLKEDILNMIDMCDDLAFTEYNKYNAVVEESEKYIKSILNNGNNIIYDICKDTVNIYSSTELLNYKLINHFVKLGILKKSKNIYIDMIDEYYIDNINMINTSYIISFKSNKLENTDPYCYSPCPHYSTQLYPFNAHENNMTELINDAVDNMEHYIKLTMHECIYSCLNNDYNIENNIITMFPDYKTKINTMTMQFSSFASCKRMYTALKYYMKDIDLTKCYMINSLQINICCLNHNMIIIINNLCKYINLRQDIFNEFKISFSFI